MAVGKIVGCRKTAKTTLEYLTQKEKVSEIKTINLCGESNQEILREFEAQASLSQRCEKPYVHISVNFDPEKEGLTIKNAEMFEYTKKYLEKMGLAEHQAVMTAHKDTVHPHVHVLVNRVQDDGLAWSDSHNYKRSVEAIAETSKEFEYEIVKQKHDLMLNRSDIERIAHGEVSWKAEIQMCVTDAIQHSNGTFEDFTQKLEDNGVQMDFNSNKTGLRYRMTNIQNEEGEDIVMKASKVGKQYQLPAIQEKLENRLEHILERDSALKDAWTKGDTLDFNQALEDTLKETYHEQISEYAEAEKMVETPKVALKTPVTETYHEQISEYAEAEKMVETPKVALKMPVTETYHEQISEYAEAEKMVETPKTALTTKQDLTYAEHTGETQRVDQREARRSQSTYHIGADSGTDRQDRVPVSDESERLKQDIEQECRRVESHRQQDAERLRSAQIRDFDALRESERDRKKNVLSHRERQKVGGEDLSLRETKKHVETDHHRLTDPDSHFARIGHMARETDVEHTIYAVGRSEAKSVHTQRDDKKFEFKDYEALTKKAVMREVMKHAPEELKHAKLFKDALFQKDARAFTEDVFKFTLREGLYQGLGKDGAFIASLAQSKTGHEVAQKALDYGLSCVPGGTLVKLGIEFSERMAEKQKQEQTQSYSMRL